MPPLDNPRHEKYAQLIVEALNNGQPKPYSQGRAYLAAGYQTKDLGKRGGSTQVASSRLFNRVLHRVKELQAIAAKNAAETIEKMVHELNEVQHEARTEKAHGAAVSAIMGKAKLLGLDNDKARPNHINYANAQSMAEIGKMLLQSVGYSQPNDIAIREAIELNDVFVAGLERIRDVHQVQLIEQQD